MKNLLVLSSITRASACRAALGLDPKVWHVAGDEQALTGYGYERIVVVGEVPSGWFDACVRTRVQPGGTITFI